MMSVIAISRTTSERLLIIGSSYGMKINKLVESTNEIEYIVDQDKEEWIFVADKHGEIRKVKACDIKVIEVDGIPIENIL